jgi:hypothetical protein
MDEKNRTFNEFLERLSRQLRLSQNYLVEMKKRLPGAQELLVDLHREIDGFVRVPSRAGLAAVAEFLQLQADSDAERRYPLVPGPEGAQ